MNQELLRREALAGRLGVSVRTVARWTAGGLIAPPAKVGGIPLWAWASVYEAIQGAPVASPKYRRRRRRA